MPEKKFNRGVVRAVVAVKKLIDGHPGNGSSTAVLASQHGISRNVLQEVFKDRYKLPIGEYRLKLRMEEARKKLKAGFSIKEVSFSLDYASPSSFCNAFRNFYKISPSEWVQAMKAKAKARAKAKASKQGKL